MKQIIFKIAKSAEWRDAIAKGYYSGSADDVRDGFIHLSSRSHLYGPLPVSNALWQRALASDDQGVPMLRDEWFTC